MILMSVFLTGQAPFKTAYLHGLVRDEKGVKMSKSLGNVIEPKVLTQKYGTDALRMALLIGVGPGADNNLGESKVKAYRNFANKIWNATRFVLMSLPEDYEHIDTGLTADDTKLISQLDDIIAEVTDDIENYRLHLAAEKLYGYFWHEFADKIIEDKKQYVGDNYNESPESKSAAFTLFEILTTSIKLLHPFMPFVTEEIWQSLPKKSNDREILMVNNWPNGNID
jgi:valyl-tRNA synthetase